MGGIKGERIMGKMGGKGDHIITGVIRGVFADEGVYGGLYITGISLRGMGDHVQLEYQHTHTATMNIYFQEELLVIWMGYGGHIIMGGML